MGSIGELRTDNQELTIVNDGDGRVPEFDEPLDDALDVGSTVDVIAQGNNSVLGTGAVSLGWASSAVERIGLQRGGEGLRVLSCDEPGSFWRCDLGFRACGTVQATDPDPCGCDLGLGYRFYSALSDMVHLCCARRGLVVLETFCSDSSAESSSRWVMTSRSL